METVGRQAAGRVWEFKGVSGAVLPGHVLWSLPLKAYRLDGLLRLVDFSELMGSVYGLERERDLGRPMLELFPEIAGTLRGLYARVQRGESMVDVEVRSRDRAGRERVWLANYQPLPDAGRPTGGPPGVLCVALDVTDRVEAQERERRSDEVRRVLAEVAFDAVYDWDLQAEVLRWNHGPRTIFGFEESRVGDTIAWWSDQIHPEDRGRVEHGLESALRGSAGVWSDEYRFRRADGTYAVVEDRARIVRGPGGEARRLIGSMRDISASRSADEALRTAERRLRLAVEGSGVGIFESDLETGEAFVSPQLSALLGYGPEGPPLGLEAFRAGLHPEDRDRVLASVERAMAMGEPLDETYRYMKASGEYGWFTQRASTIVDPGSGRRRFAGTIEDVTAKRREGRLLEETQRTARIGGWEYDVRSGVITWSRETYELHEVSPETHTPTVENGLAFYAPASRERVRAVLREAIERGTPVEFEADVVTATGRPIVALVTVRSEREGDEVTRLYGSFQDITRLRELQARVLHAEKMESVGRLAGGIAHDFNNWMTAIVGYAKVALEQVAEGSQGAGALRSILHAAGRASGLTRQLLAFASRQGVTPRPTDLESSMAPVLNLIPTLVGPRVRVEVTRGVGVGHAMVDPAQFEQVLINMAMNARDAMPQGGTLTIAFERDDVPHPDPRLHGRLAPGRYVRVRVSDSGEGMNEATRARVFEPFFTTKPVGKGSGLGLAMCYGMVEQAGGHIAVESEPGRGTRFTIWLPWTVADAAEVEGTVAASAPVGDRAAGGTAGSGERQPRVLVVEDEPLVARLVELVLKAARMQPVVRHDGSGAMAVIESAEPLDAMFTDLTLPDATGIDLARAWKARRPGKPVVITSGYTGEQSPQTECEGALFLPKPYEPQDVVRLLREAMGLPR